MIVLTDDELVEANRGPGRQVLASAHHTLAGRLEQHGRAARERRVDALRGDGRDAQGAHSTQ